MEKTHSNTWKSSYTSESKKTSVGKIKEAFRGKDEFNRYLKKVESVVVHYFPPHAAFDTTLISKKIFYAWENGFDVILNSKNFQLAQDYKMYLGQIYHPFTIGNSSSQKSALLVEVSSSAFSEASYKTIGQREVIHMPVVSRYMEINEFLGGELEQITVYNLDPYSLEGNHHHNDGKKELFLVAKGLVHTFEKKIQSSADNLIKRIKSAEIDYESYDQGGSFCFENNEYSHAIVAGPKKARLIEISNICSSDDIEKDITVPEDFEQRKKLLDKLS